MSETPRRRWFQFHLSTMVFLVLSAALLMQWNFVPRNVHGAFGWPFYYAMRDFPIYTPFAIADGLSALLVLYFVFKISNKLNSPAGQHRLRSLKARLWRTRVLTRLAVAVSTVTVAYLNYANGVTDGGWVKYGWPAPAMRIYQLRRSYPWGFIANEYAYGDLALDLLVGTSIVSLVFFVCEWGAEDSHRDAE